MTPQQADIAFVLEPLHGLAPALFAIHPGSRAAALFDFAVRLEHGGRNLVGVHHALLRVLTHDDCARVFLFVDTLPAGIAEAVRQLPRLTDSEREAARRRVPPAPARQPIVVAPGAARDPHVLIVDDDPDIAAALRDVLEAPARWAIVSDVDAAKEIAREQAFNLILCEAGRAFGIDGLLAKLPLDVARRVLVLARPPEIVNARWRLQGTERILAKPLESWVLRDRVVRAGTMDLLSVPDVSRMTGPEPARRSLTLPPASAPFTVLLVDVDEEVQAALRGIFPEEARHLMRRDPVEAAELALSAPFHVIACSANAALRPRSVLDALAEEDSAGADRVIVLAPARDVPYVKHNLEVMRRRNTVLALPVDDASLGRAVFRDHPALAARLAVAEVVTAARDSRACARVEGPRFRRLGVLVVDDDLMTEILFAASETDECGALAVDRLTESACRVIHEANAEVTLASNTMQAFEHVTSRAVDLLVISATMRGDGGEPFYRVLWRLKPELKRRCVLVTPADLSPRSAAMSTPPRCVERPLTHDSINRIVETFARR